MANTKGPRLLKEWLEKHGISRSSAAEALGVSGMTVTDWLRDRKTPRAAYREAIERWTVGAVPATEWASEEERRLADVQPFAPPAPVEPAATPGEA